MKLVVFCVVALCLASGHAADTLRRLRRQTASTEANVEATTEIVADAAVETSLTNEVSALVSNWAERTDQERLQLVDRYGQAQRLPAGSPERARAEVRFQTMAAAPSVSQFKGSIAGLTASSPSHTAGAARKADDMRFAFRTFIRGDSSSYLNDVTSRPARANANLLCSKCGSPCQTDPVYGNPMVFELPAGGSWSSGSTRQLCARSDSRGYNQNWPLDSSNALLSSNTGRMNHMVQWQGGVVTLPFTGCGQTVHYTCDQPTLPFTITLSRRVTCGTRACEVTCNPGGLHTDSFECYNAGTWTPFGVGGRCDGDAIIFRVHGAGRDECSHGAPDVDYDGWVALARSTGRVMVQFVVEKFPWFEANAWASGGAGGGAGYSRAIQVAKHDANGGLLSIAGAPGEDMRGSVGPF
jgi:hypothetical protein